MGKDKIFYTWLDNQIRRQHCSLVGGSTSLTFKSQDLTFKFHEGTPLLQQVLEKIPFAVFVCFYSLPSKVEMLALCMLAHHTGC